MIFATVMGLCLSEFKTKYPPIVLVSHLYRSINNVDSTNQDSKSWLEKTRTNAVNKCLCSLVQWKRVDRMEIELIPPVDVEIRFFHWFENEINKWNKISYDDDSSFAWVSFVLLVTMILFFPPTRYATSPLHRIVDLANRFRSLNNSLCRFSIDRCSFFRLSWFLSRLTKVLKWVWQYLRCFNNCSARKTCAS